MSTMNMRRYVDAKIVRERAQEAKMAGIQHMLWENNILSGHGKAELNVEKKRRELEGEQCRREMMTDDMAVRKAQDFARKEQVTVMEEKLAHELERRHAQRVREEQNRKRICESSEELRSLKARLHAAQVTKERSAQIMEKQLKYEEERARDQVMATVMEHERLKAINDHQVVEQSKLVKAEKAKEMQLEQIRLKESMRDESRREYEKERAQVDAVVEKIRQEDALEQEIRDQKKAETKKHLQDFTVQQAEWRREAERRADAENEEIEAYARFKAAREQAIADEKERKEEEKRQIFFRMVGAAESRNKEAEELEYLRNELYSEEHEAELRRREQAAEQKRLEDRAEMLRAYEEQMMMKEERQRIEREEEMKLRAMLLAKFAEDERIEQMNEQKRRMKIQEHKREVEKLVEARRNLFAEERAKEAGAYQFIEEQEKERLVIIEEERRRLLTEYASELKDFLPKGVLERETDIPLVYGVR